MNSLLKSVITGVLTFLVIAGLMFMFNRESAMIENQGMIVKEMGKQVERITRIEQFLNQAQQRQIPPKPDYIPGQEKK